MSVTQFKDGLKVETTPGTSVVTDPAHDCYLWGAISEESQHPSPEVVLQYTPPGYNVKELGAGMVTKSLMILRGFWGVIAQNGVPIYGALGDSSTVGDVHTLVPTTDGSDIPSYTMNCEQKGTGTDEEYQFLGCKVDSLKLIWDSKDAPMLMYHVEWLAMKAQDGQALTNDPALQATANEHPYEGCERKWDSGGTPVNLDGLQRVELSILNRLSPLYAHKWDTGVSTRHWPWRLHEAPLKQYLISMMMHPNTIERAMWDELIATGNTKDMTLKFTKGGYADDYILVTASDCQVVRHDIKTPDPNSSEPMMIIVEVIPRALSIDVKDLLADAVYGD